MEHYFLLGKVGVLVLIDQHVLELVHVLAAYVFMMFKEQIGLHQQVVEVHGISLTATLGIAHVDLGLLGLLGVEERAVDVGSRQHQVVLGHRDMFADGSRFVDLVIESHLLDDTLHQRTGIGLVVNSKIGVIAYRLGLGTQYTGKDGVEGAHLQIAGLVQPHQPPYALLHLAGRLVGKGQGQDVPGLHALLHQIGYLVGQHARLARACTSYHQRGTIAIDDRLALTLIERI